MHHSCDGTTTPIISTVTDLQIAQPHRIALYPALKLVHPRLLLQESLLLDSLAALAHLVCYRSRCFCCCCSEAISSQATGRRLFGSSVFPRTRALLEFLPPLLVQQLLLAPLHTTTPRHARSYESVRPSVRVMTSSIMVPTHQYSSTYINDMGLIEGMVFTAAGFFFRLSGVVVRSIVSTVCGRTFL